MLIFMLMLLGLETTELLLAVLEIDLGASMADLLIQALVALLAIALAHSLKS